MKEEKLIPLSLSKLVKAVSVLSRPSEAGKISSWRYKNYLHNSVAHCSVIRALSWEAGWYSGLKLLIRH